jgi:hypothetical protein
VRFVSQYPGYKFQIRPQRTRALGDGGVEVTQEPIYAEFQPVSGGAMVYENEVAQSLSHFAFRGNTQDRGEAIPTDPVQRLAVFDTNEQLQHLSDEDKDFVEKRLMQACEEFPEEIILVTTKPIEAPFPSYDEWDGPSMEMLVVKLIEDGHDLEAVLYYERVFGPRRQKVIDALEAEVEKRKDEVVAA